jgi:hypothetical protein
MRVGLSGQLGVYSHWDFSAAGMGHNFAPLAIVSQPLKSNGEADEAL